MDRGTMLIAVGVAFVAMALFASYTQAYIWLPWVDIPLHLVFGAWLALFLMHYGHGGVSRILIAVILVGTAWELFEFAFDTFFAHPYGLTPAQHGWPDTFSDTAANLAGAVAAMLYERRAR
jgi:hypothetical protein